MRLFPSRSPTEVLSRNRALGQIVDRGGVCPSHTDVSGPGPLLVPSQWSYDVAMLSRSPSDTAISPRPI